MKKFMILSSLVMSLCFSIVYAAPPLPDNFSTATVESLVKSYVDDDFIHEELPPPEKCEKYSNTLMFAYDWKVVINNIGPYDSARKLVQVKATIIVRCGPFQAQPRSLDQIGSSDFPLRSETPIDFQIIVDPKNSSKWKVHEVTLWKSKQKVIEG